MAWTVRRSDYPTHVLPLHPPPKTHPAPSWHRPLLNAHPFSQSSPSHPPLLMSFWMTLVSYQIQKIMRKVKSTLQRNQDRNKKGKKSTILVFYHHPQNKKKNKNQPMADEETLEDSSNISPDNSSYNSPLHNSPSNLLCPPGAQDTEQSAATPGKAPAEQSFVQGSNV